MQRDFAGHRHLPPDRTLRHGADQGRGDRRAGRRSVFGRGAFRNMDVVILSFK